MTGTGSAVAADGRATAPLRAFGAGLRLAVTTFTVLPVRPGRVDRAAAGVAMALAPLVGLLLGGLVAGEVTAARLAFHGPAGALLVAALAVATLALLTRGMHLDGLADTADGLGSYGDADRALAVMRAPDVGAFGIASLVLVVLVDVAALATAVATGRGALAAAVAVVTGRLAVTWSCTPRTPPARPDGLGATVAGTTTAGTAALATAVVAAAAAGWGYAADGWPGAARAAGAVVAGLAVAHALRAHLVRRLGGVTGDVLGALVEVATAVALVVLAAG